VYISWFFLSLRRLHYRLLFSSFMPFASHGPREQSPSRRDRFDHVLVTCARWWSCTQATRITRFARLPRGCCTNTCRVHTPFLSVLFLIITHTVPKPVPHIAFGFRTCFCCTGSEMLCFSPPIQPTTHVLHVLTCEVLVSAERIYLLGLRALTLRVPYCTMVETASRMSLAPTRPSRRPTLLIMTCKYSRRIQFAAVSGLHQMWQ